MKVLCAILWLTLLCTLGTAAGQSKEIRRIRIVSDWAGLEPSRHSELVIELEGKNKYIGGDLYADDGTSQGDCCPTMYTRTRYKWNGRRFVRQGQPESFPLKR
jgi:hypothetical protein